MKRLIKEVSNFLHFLVPNSRIVFSLIMGIFIISALTVIGLSIYSDPNNSSKPVLLSISTSIISAYIFYIILIYFPRKRRMRIVREQFIEDVMYMKSIIIGDLLQCADSYNEGNIVEQLMDPVEFKRYFNVDLSSDQNRWHHVMNYLEDNPAMYRKIIYQLRQFREEILFILNVVRIDDPRIHRYFKITAERIYKIVNDEHFGEEIKALTGFLWELLAEWSFSEGYSDRKILHEMVQNINESVS